MSPESLTNSSNKEGIDGEALDIWAFGVTLFCFVFLELPFYHSGLEDLIVKITKEEFIFIRIIFIFWKGCVSEK